MIEYVLTGCASFSLGSVLTWMLRHKIYRLRTANRVLHDNTKLVIVARTDLPVTVGKLASQCAHAAVSCYSRVKIEDPELAAAWEAQGQPKIVVKCNSESGLMKLAHEAHGAKLIAAIIQDAGRTQVRSGTKTVLGIGPARKEDIDKITGHLKLL